MPRPWLLTLAMLLLLALRPAGACEDTTTYYLDPAGGNDANDCATESTACRSAAKLQTLINQVTAGGKILLKRGTTLVVTATLVIDKHSGTAEQPIVLGAYGPESAARPLLDSSTMGGGAMQVSCKKQGYWTIQDLDFKARKGAIAWASCHHSTLQNSTISQCDQECLRIYRADSSSFSEHMTVKNVAITATERAEGIYIGTDPGQSGGSYDLTRHILIDNVTISGSTQAGGGWECIEFKAGTSYITIQNSTFSDNYVTQNGCIFSSTGSAPDVPRGGNVIKNNTISNITGAEGYGIRIRNDAVIENNDVQETSQVGILLESLSGYPTYRRTVSVKTSTK